MAEHHSPLKSDVRTDAALKDDELCSIMAFIKDKHDLLAVMRACRKTYSIGIPFLAGLRAEQLHRKDLCSLHDFMIRYPLSFTGLHVLHFSRCDEEITQDDAKLLKDLLEGGNAFLTRLSLPCLNQLDTQDKFISAVASLTKVQFLNAWSDRSGALRSILSQLRSPLAEIILHFEGENHNDPVLYLANFTSTLKELHLWSSTPSRADVCYSNLTRLTMCPRSVPQLSVLMTAFPSLEYLDLASDDYSRDPALTMAKLEETRRQSIAFQRHGHSWPSLKRLCGDPLDLYCLGVQHDVEDVVLCTEEPIYEGDYLHWLLSLLPPLRPKTLTLALSDDDDVLALAFCQGFENVIHLYLRMFFSGKRDFAVAWGALLEGLRYCQALRYLKLSLGVQDEYEAFGLDDAKVNATADCLEGLDLAAARRQVKAVIPGIEATVFNIMV